VRPETFGPAMSYGETQHSEEAVCWLVEAYNEIVMAQGRFLEAATLKSKSDSYVHEFVRGA
jgi:hypothetical protein